jgi:hypothetical protein
MVFHMKAKTTLSIDDEVMRRVKERAARDGITMSQFVETALRRLLDEPQRPRKPVKLPTFSMGEPLVDISNKEALYELLDEDLGRKYNFDARRR